MSNYLINPLCVKIFSEANFIKDYEQLVKYEFAIKKSPDENLDYQQIKKLVETAAIFSLSSNPNFQKLALKIAIFLLRQFKDKYKDLSYVLEIILSRLGDLPTIHHMYMEKDGKDYFSYFPESQNFDMSFLKFPEILEMKILNQFEISPEYILNLTNFQSRILHNLLNGQNVSFSAPTSAGKSFVIHNFISNQILKYDNYNVIYLVPTKSLIAEVQNSILSILKQLPIKLSEVAVVNSAERLNTEQYENIGKRVLVLTQERLQHLLTHNSEFKIDLLIVDEAQKVKEVERGVILEDVVNDIIAGNPSLQIVFISPFIKNPEKFWRIFNINDNIKDISTSKTPVGQNIFFVQLQNKEATVSLLLEEFDRNLVEIEKNIT